MKWHFEPHSCTWTRCLAMREIHSPLLGARLSEEGMEARRGTERQAPRPCPLRAGRPVGGPRWATEPSRCTNPEASETPPPHRRRDLLPARSPNHLLSPTRDESIETRKGKHGAGRVIFKKAQGAHKNCAVSRLPLFARKRPCPPQGSGQCAKPRWPLSPLPGDE